MTTILLTNVDLCDAQKERLNDMRPLPQMCVLLPRDFLRSVLPFHKTIFFADGMLRLYVALNQ